MIHYIGDGAFIVGVPARDMTEAEAEQYGGAAFLAATGLYEIVEIEPASEIVEEG